MSIWQLLNNEKYDLRNNEPMSTNLVPKLKEKSTMIWFVHQWLCVMTIMLEGSIYVPKISMIGYSVGSLEQFYHE